MSLIPTLFLKEVGIESIRNQHICVRAARPSGRARCGAGAGCSAIRYQSLQCSAGMRTGPGLANLVSILVLDQHETARRARIYGASTFVSLNSKLESDNENEEAHET